MPQTIVLPFWVIYEGESRPSATEKAGAFVERLKVELAKEKIVVGNVVQWAIEKGNGAPVDGAVSGAMKVDDHAPREREEFLLVMHEAMQAANTTDPKARLAIGSEPTDKHFFY